MISFVFSSFNISFCTVISMHIFCDRYTWSTCRCRSPYHSKNSWNLLRKFPRVKNRIKKIIWWVKSPSRGINSLISYSFAFSQIPHSKIQRVCKIIHVDVVSVRETSMPLIHRSLLSGRKGRYTLGDKSQRLVPAIGRSDNFPPCVLGIFGGNCRSDKIRCIGDKYWTNAHWGDMSWRQVAALVA